MVREQFLKNLKRLRYVWLLFILGLGTAISVGGGGAFAQNLPELLPEDAPNDPLSREEILPDRDFPESGDTQSLRQNAQQRKEAELDKLFDQLHHTFDAQEADRISRQIQGLWSQSGSDTVDLLMQWAEAAMDEADWVQAMDFLDNVVALKPDFAEGWMRRASIHIQRGDLTLAMLDLAQVLQVEPRHYQAMSQLGVVMEMTDRERAAILIYEQALTLYPQFVRLQRRIERLLNNISEQAL